MSSRPSVLRSSKTSYSYSHPESLPISDGKAAQRPLADFANSLEKRHSGSIRCSPERHGSLLKRSSAGGGRSGIFFHLKSVFSWTENGPWTPPESRPSSIMIPPQQPKSAYDGTAKIKPLPPLPIVDTFESPAQELSCSNSDFRYAYGRQFLKSTDVIYSLPVDEQEVDRLQEEHYLMKELFGGRLYHAPVTEQLIQGAHILNLGCGCGSWCMEMAAMFPTSTVTGCDIAPIYPASVIPANCNFERCDVANRLPFSDGSFDFVVSRNMALAVRFDSWQDYVDEMVRVSRPGAYIEIIEMDWDVKNRGVNMNKWMNTMNQLWRKRGVNPRIARLLRNYLSNISDLNMSFISMPIGDWGGQLGSCTWDLWKQLMYAALPFYLSRTGQTKVEYGRLVNRCIHDIHVTQSYCNYWVYNGKALKKVTTDAD
ncbi:S-adenosyl-L-methionine-dependent methyltransferase [Umbelopsis sp. PMI_123]|nr:S-adenosyl-L-methionine-dependent methyltransferase [Umbelopsis sp. PMI_123]